MRWTVTGIVIAVALVPLLMSQLPTLLGLMLAQRFTIPILEPFTLLVVM
jgi:hypothetical protein